MNKKTFDKIQKHVGTWLRQDSEDAVTQQLFHDDPLAFFDSLDSTNDKNSIALISMNFEHLSHWHLVHYESALLNQNLMHGIHLGLSAKYAKAMLETNAALISSGLDRSINCGVLLTNAALTLSLSIIAGWKKDVYSILETLIAGLDTPLLDLRRNPYHRCGELYRHFWFVMFLCADAFSKKIVLDSYSHPKNMSPYTDVLKNWKTDDLNMVQHFVSSMADFHLEQTRNTEHSKVNEFDVESRALFPYEILSFLRIREWMGLKNPESYVHPLMNIALARLPAEPIFLPCSDFAEKVNIAVGIHIID
ncbi:hypothetical protein LF887_09485 [Chryseobacterium sp. MEBOG06]|uniref:hypothetical protein n=1 Tax=Chryseobacterium sp. MEBOG06 TaxID=2879938 RepID=UPI001F33D9DF|nr:hypothetical protein [Chryseobacterium sp. MEBOG06]UKB85833.1 hypothetical protein LF887_09485 [Chryseobacterium sp. MEBOG06]